MLASLRSSAASLALKRRASSLSTAALSKAQALTKDWYVLSRSVYIRHKPCSTFCHRAGTSFQGGSAKNYINGAFTESAASEWKEVRDPSTQTVLSQVPESTADEFEAAVSAAETAFQSWSRTSVLTRQRFVLECVITLPQVRRS